MRIGAVLIATIALGACGPASGLPAASRPAAEPPASRAQAPAPAAPPAVTAAVAVDAFDAIGTEPFWGLSIRPDQISLSGADRATQSGPNPGVRWQGRRRTWTTRTPAGVLTASIEPGECSDGMSDRVYPYAAEVILGGEVLKGCATRAKS